MPTVIAQDEVEAATTYKKRRPPLNFTEMGIAKGSALHMVGRDAIVTVCADRKVLFEGEETSLTAVTMKLMGLDYAIQPTPHWTFEGKSLTEIYNETYNSN